MVSAAGSRLPRMNDDEEAPDRRLHPVVYWLIVLAIAVALGVSAPAFFLLGFWEMAPLVPSSVRASASSGA